MRLRGGITILLLTLLLSACVHKIPKGEHYFQAMGDAGEVVVTVDTSDLKRLPFKIEEGSFSALLSRVNRLSVALYDLDEEEEFSGLSNYAYYGALEGNIPAFLTNSAFKKDPDWSKVTEGKVRYYRNNQLGLDVYAVKQGLLLFASENYMKAYNKTYGNREVKIEQALADRMASALFGFYLASPKVMLDIGLNIPKTVIPHIASMTFVVEEGTKEGYVLGGIINMKSEKLARSLSILVKSSYISDKRRNKEPLGDLTDLFILEGDAFYINSLPLTEAELKSFQALFAKLLPFS
ncbi:MAG: hypothetical protein WCY78_01800 [Sphaerochaetaceae bacterium]